ncbi:MAG: SpoIIE family protein phosphatase, partial [Bacteroidales bacterium]|nr:SpoIIE family protein phosphatase [Bacteroidales bacterium]
KATAAMLMAEVNTQQSRLALNRRKLAEQEEEITAKQDQVEQANRELSSREEELSDREEKIRQQESAIATQDNTINQQQTAITGVIIFIVVVIFLIILIVRSIRERARANVALRRKNQELNQQKEEIDKQAEQLEGINKELEKLSIVAGKTQNAIVIMDRNGYFEWVNAGFTRFFGYTLQLLRNERDENIVNVSGNKSIRNILFKCVSNKQTIVFESDSRTRAGKILATQTTLTPILNNKGDVTQLVAIYSDINTLKEQEAAIRSQNEELMQQKNTLEMQKTQIEEQTKSIKRGIDYAQTIQRTILPPNEFIKKYFDCFVLFRPKDIVSGDFYWFSTAQDGDRNYQFIGDFDCTGHGVPGAFMSLIGNRVLNEVINVRNTYSPRDIMDALNLGIIKALKQEQSTNNDGMDTCLCRVEQTSEHDYSVVFCGAKRPLYYLPVDSDEVMQLKGDRKSIGGTQKKRGNVQFTDQEIVLHSGDTMFLCSDGISDQCDHDRKKFGSDRFVNMIRQYRNEPMENQGVMFSTELDNFRGTEEQRDDISVIGIKFR